MPPDPRCRASYNPVTQEASNTAGRQPAGHLRLRVSYLVEQRLPWPAAATAGSTPASAPCSPTAAAAARQLPDAGPALHASSNAASEGGAGALEARSGASLTSIRPAAGGGSITSRISRMVDAISRTLSDGGAGMQAGAGPPSPPSDREALAAARQLVNAVWRLWRKGVQLPAPLGLPGSAQAAQRLSAALEAGGGKQQQARPGRASAGAGTRGKQPEGKPGAGVQGAPWFPPPAELAAGEVLQALELSAVAAHAASDEAARCAHPVAGPLLPPGPSYWALLQLAATLLGIRAAAVRLVLLDQVLASWRPDAAHLAAAQQLLPPLLAAQRARMLSRAEAGELAKCAGAPRGRAPARGGICMLWVTCWCSTCPAHPGRASPAALPLQVS